MLKKIFSSKIMGAGVIGFTYGITALFGQYVGAKLIEIWQEKHPKKDADGNVIIDAKVEEVKK